MATLEKIETNVEIKTNADKYWRTFRDYRTVFPKVFSKYRSIEILEGDGKSVGSVLRHITFEGSLKSATERIEAVDDEKRTLTYAVIDADILQDYKNYKGHISVTPKGNGSEVKWIAEYEKASQEVPDPISIKDYLVDTFLKLDAYIQKA
ncbi:unnamed protein product [Lupinus luteus]|uniref:Bet v I/Major latex protein domain-containing protein n=1 Tax=Lupinus luteus TaxID=3873 RepID=A0AAV1WR68_LUPLU